MVHLWKPWTDGQRLLYVEEPGRNLFHGADWCTHVASANEAFALNWSITYDFIYLFICVGWVVFPWEWLLLKPEQLKLSFLLILEILIPMPRYRLKTVHFISDLWRTLYIQLIAAWVLVDTVFPLNCAVLSRLHNSWNKKVQCIQHLVFSEFNPQ